VIEIVNEQVTIYATSKNTQDRLTQRPSIPLKRSVDQAGPSLVVDDRIRYQSIEGFGGAFTEAGAVTLQKMPPEKQEEMLRAYFDPQLGNGYSLCRTHINSCDFALGNYAYTEVEGDTCLEHFTIERDRQALIPMISRAREISGNSFKLFASPWSPPAWMKTTGQMNRGGKLKDEYREAWARYYARYINEYAREGIPIWGLTVQNEPEAVQSWDSCIYTADEERIFVRDFLGPTLASAGLGDVKIIIWDHNRDELYARAKGVLDDPEAARYVWGVGFHWYMADKFENVALVHDAFPGLALLLTEACVEHGPHQGEWSSGERYARSVVQDLNHWAAGWVDWNLILDQQGGPNHVGNYCSAPIIADTISGNVYYQSSYYYLGHFSRFIRPGAQRVLCATNRDELEATAAINPDGSLTAIALNRTDQDITFDLIHNDLTARIVCPTHGIITAVWRK